VKAKARPIAGISPHDRLVSRGLCSPKRDCGDPFSATVLLQRQNTLSPQGAFSRHGGIYLVRCGFKIKTKPRGGAVPPPAGRPRAASRWSAPSPGKRTCREDRVLSHRPQMSSGRLFLDRVARQQGPSPLHRHPDRKTVDEFKERIYHRTVTVFFPLCLTPGVHPIDPCSSVFIRGHTPVIVDFDQ
jgi:hypothetical protein